MRGTQRRMLNRIAWALLLGIATIALSQCRAVNDELTGVNLATVAKNNPARHDCLDACHKQLEAARRAEDQRHREAIRACGSDKTCRKAEERQHKDIQQQLKVQERDCRRNCYNEGAGSAGH